MVKPSPHSGIRPYLGIGTVLLLWWIAKATILASSIYVPGPRETFVRIYSLFAVKGVLTDIVHTLKRFLAGYAIAIAAGIPIGLVLGYFRKGYASMEVLLDFFRSIPVTALFPLFILFFGISGMTITAMVATSCVFVIILNTAYGVIYTNYTRLRFMRSLKATWFDQFKELILFEALPFIFVGLRISISFALIVVVVVEMFIGTQYGLGSAIYKAYETFLISDVYALIIIIGLLGYLLNKLILLAERRCIHWKSTSGPA